MREAVLLGVASGLAVTLFASLFRKRRVCKAICVLPSHGTVRLYAQNRTQTRFVCDLRGLPVGVHGFHVHEKGDLSRECASTCDHYNPTRALHGGPLGSDRHRGDLGNIVVDPNGTCTTQVVADVTVDEIVGRAIVVHADPDDLGLADTDESRKTGSAGARIACGVIGIA